MTTEQPEPQTTEPEPEPGGADATDDPRYGDAAGPPTSRDLPPGDSPVDDSLPPELQEHDDEKTQEPDRTSGEGPLPQEPPA